MEAADSRANIASTQFGVGLRPRAKSAGRLLGALSDDRLVARVRKGDDAAFTVLYERYQARLLSFCRQMLGSQAEAEDAVQQTFINAYKDMVRSDKRLQIRPWLYRIARNQSLSLLRARRQTAELSGAEPSLTGLSEQVRERGDLREMLADVARLPADQREALVLTELHGNSHVEVAGILGCDKEKVKSLVFQARSSLMKSREVRDVSCADIQKQLAVLKGGSLRRTVIRRHLRECDACRMFRDEVKRQRAAMAIILPVVPATALKFGAASALAAGKTAAAATAGSAASGGAIVGSSAGAGVASSVAAKVGVSVATVKATAAAAAVTVVAVGGVSGVEATRNIGHRQTGSAIERPNNDRGTNEAKLDGRTQLRTERSAERAAGGALPRNRAGKRSRSGHRRSQHRRADRLGRRPALRSPLRGDRSPKPTRLREPKREPQGDFRQPAPQPKPPARYDRPLQPEPSKPPDNSQLYRPQP